jgi:transcription-repair coupling factor (superfamily II helicase)
MHRFTHNEIDILLVHLDHRIRPGYPQRQHLDRRPRGYLRPGAALPTARPGGARIAQRAYAYFFRTKRNRPRPKVKNAWKRSPRTPSLARVTPLPCATLKCAEPARCWAPASTAIIASVGFHLYTRLLSQAVRQQRIARSLPAQEASAALINQESHLPVNVDLPISVGIPVEYVPDQNMRLRLYRRLADMQSESEIEAMQEEFTDRFGSLPEIVRNLFFQMKVKLRADAAGLASISLEGDQLVLRYPPLPEGVSSRNLPNLGGPVRTGKNAYWISEGNQGEGKRFATLRLPNPGEGLRLPNPGEGLRLPNPGEGLRPPNPGEGLRSPNPGEGSPGGWQVILLDTLLLLTRV